MATILYVDDEPALTLIVEDTLERAGHVALSASNVAEALGVISRNSVDLIISDYKMPGLSGLEFLELLRDEGYQIPLIMLTGHASIEHAVAAIKAGAIDYITKPVRPEQLEMAVTQALEVVRLRRENEALKSEVMGLRGERAIVGDSPALQRVMQTIAMAAPTRATVLIQGESGTGKELVARALHDQSERRDRAFIKLNCAALPEGLIESALFGHEKGAFTGAIKRVEGAFERAHGGTLLLDEITEMRLDLQAKLLRVLQEQEFERVGGTAQIKVDVRVLATTNRDLAEEVAEGRFREDLYYRLSVLPVHLPPLRERPEDIPLLVYRFAMRAAQEAGKEINGVAPEALEMLQRRQWPGNIRELQHAVERAVILATEKVLTPRVFEQDRPSAQALANRLTPHSAGAAIPPPDGAVLKTLRIEDAERELIRRAMEKTGDNRTKAAELLGISVRTLWNKLKG